MLSSAENSAAKNMLLTSMIWFIVPALFGGLFVAIKLVWPTFLGDTSFLTYGRLRMVHTNGELLGWLSMVQVGAMYYMIPRLLGTKLWSEKLGNFTVWMWNVGLLVGALTLLAGITSGVEYAELLWPLDLYIAVMVILVIVNIFMTIAQRKEKQFYVSVWYFVASILWLPLVYIIGNIPEPFLHLPGVHQLNFNWFYGHNVLGLWFTTMGVAMAYYLLPKVTGLPIYSHRLSLIGFWTIAIFYVWNGPHHLSNGPIPAWLQKAGIAPSLLLIIPVWSVVANMFLTVKGNWHLVKENVIVKFILTASIFYVAACLQGPFHSLMTVSAVLKFTHWTVGHAHMAPYATFSFIGMAGMFYIIPRVTGRELYSWNLANWSYWLGTIGFLVMALDLWTAGILQGFAWADGKDAMTVVESMRPFMMIRIVGGVLMVASMLVFIWNIMKTVTSGKVVTMETSKNKKPVKLTDTKAAKPVQA
ncbi:cbb3-type cytochrome c oxidase subunit I [Heliophilum fasciatum]|uniref:Cytochrome c oxidase cbb3-type subunit 1 n=1 Tax=Heliophilum fasciatum TaxID=35700 RepID=A0A4R2RHX7_9FIRM|nr:cbb3-type cytochrome c oxidase subunit I [Heliophilum fasciatum]MCW2278916.1 cbb3-type cytochrome c oxidase subunit I [Heliophilum fasciatum]TCP62049.1 cytochrome c oxidase cbb3-type subunit 1 [Heliophilum fasciatum]